jgi:type 1 glutamine amidotransferase
LSPERARLAFVALALGLSGCDALRVFFPAHVYETTPPELPTELAAPAVLVFTKTNGFRHEEAIPAGVALIEQIVKERGGSVYATENGAVFNPEQLSRFAVAVWHQTSGDLLTAEQRAAFQSWLEAGGGFVGVHGAGGDPAYEWAWYVDELIGAQFIGHTMGPQFQTATWRTEASDHPASARLPASWSHEEEIYSFAASPRARPGFHVLVSVDEHSYSPRQKILWSDKDLAMGDHPMVWWHCVGRGRALYSALGHRAEAYAEPEMKALLAGAIAWAARAEGSGCD